MTVALCIFTDGRQPLISRTIPSALQSLDGLISEYWIFDDSADPDYQAWLTRTFSEFSLVADSERLGFGGNIRRAWEILSWSCDADYIFHLEDDFTFNRPLNLQALIRTLDRNPHLIQLALRRQSWNEDERAAGGVVEQHPDAYQDCFDDSAEWLEHRLFFTTNPSLYRRPLCAEGWPNVPQSEGIFTHQLLNAGIPNIVPSRIRFGYWGSRSSQPWVTHIGTERIGHGY